MNWLDDYVHITMSPTGKAPITADGFHFLVNHTSDMNGLTHCIIKHIEQQISSPIQTLKFGSSAEEFGVTNYKGCVGKQNDQDVSNNISEFIVANRDGSLSLTGCTFWFKGSRVTEVQKIGILELIKKCWTPPIDTRRRSDQFLLTAIRQNRHDPHGFALPSERR